MLYLSLLFLHFLGLALGVGTSFAMLRLGAATRELSQEERVKFMLRASEVAKNGSAGLGLFSPGCTPTQPIFRPKRQIYCTLYTIVLILFSEVLFLPFLALVHEREEFFNR